MGTKFIAYYRVSTQRQGRSGLGLEAQRELVEHYVDGTNGCVIEHFVEVESGKRSERSKLSEAIKNCRKYNAILLIAKLDRLARRVHFISGLMESGIQFRAADMPNADRFMLHVYAAMAEEEGRRISDRTKQALKAAKARGVQLGTSSVVLARQNREHADSFAQQVGPQISLLKTEGLSIRKIVERLNSDKVASYGGGNWHPTSVQRVWTRYNKSSTTGKILNPPCQTDHSFSPH